MPGETVLIIHQQPAIGEMMSQYLLAHGYSPRRAHNHLAPLAAPEDDPISVMVLSARLLQEEEGLLTRLRGGKTTWSVPILALVEQDTEPGTSPSPPHHLPADVDRVLGFPCTARKLAETIDEMLVAHQAQEAAQQRLREAIDNHIATNVSVVLEEMVQERAQQLSEAIIEQALALVKPLVEEALQTQVRQMIDQEFDTHISEVVKRVAEPTILSYAEEVVTSTAADTLSEQAQRILEGFERDEAPKVARKVFEKVSADQITARLERMLTEGDVKFISQISEQILQITEKAVRRQAGPILQESAQQSLEALIRKQVALQLQQLR